MSRFYALDRRTGVVEEQEERRRQRVERERAEEEQARAELRRRDLEQQIEGIRKDIEVTLPHRIAATEAEEAKAKADAERTGNTERELDVVRLRIRRELLHKRLQDCRDQLAINRALLADESKKKPLRRTLDMAAAHIAKQHLASAERDLDRHDRRITERERDLAELRAKAEATAVDSEQAEWARRIADVQLKLDDLRANRPAIAQQLAEAQRRVEAILNPPVSVKVAG